MIEPEEIVARAIKNRELHKLLLGTDGYDYLPKWSPSPWNTDLTILLDVYYDMAPSAALLEKAIRKIVRQYEGLVPVAICILFEADRVAESGKTLGLNLDKLSAKLQKSIQKYRTQLASDHRPGAECWGDGMLGELRRLSSLVGELGVREFLPQESPDAERRKELQIEKVAKLLEDLSEHLHGHNASDWGLCIDRLAGDWKAQPDNSTKGRIRSIYGGAGSFNDLVLHEKGIPLPSANHRLCQLRSDLYEACEPFAEQSAE